MPDELQYHLRGCRRIADAFGVSRRTVIDWVNEGAPIFCVGRSYQACYLSLVKWLERHKKAKPKKPVNCADGITTVSRQYHD